MTAHEHSWVNTSTGVACTTCGEKITAPECPHEYRFDRIEDYRGAAGMRKAILICNLCGQEQARLTARTDEEIAAEIEKANG